MGTDDDRERARPRCTAEHHGIGGGAEIIHQGGQLAGLADVDHDRTAVRFPRGIDLCGHEDQLTVGIPDVQQEVDEVLIIDVAREAAGGQAIGGNVLDV